jgi:crotonobetainyl-CoA hydratase
VSVGRVRVEQADGVCVITLDRAEHLNAIDAAMAGQLGRAAQRADADDDVRAIVLTGAGRAFCAGADLHAVRAGESIAPLDPSWGFAGLARQWLTTPVIAAVNGVAAGGGTEIALSCDIVVAAESARFSLPEVRHGLIAGAGGLLRGPHAIGLQRTLYLALTADSVDARTATDWGLATVCVPDADLLTTARQLAARIAAHPPVAVQQSKRLAHRTAASASTWFGARVPGDPWLDSAEALAIVRQQHTGASVGADRP